jgi:hypothetical protein
MEAAMMADALKRYIEWVGAIHDDGCPEDDTCECSGKPINDGVNAAYKFLVEIAAVDPELP